MTPEQIQTRRESLTYDAIDPQTGQKCKVVISHKRLLYIAGRGKGAIKEARYTVQDILLKPTGIFEGLTSEGDEDKTIRGCGWRCFCGIPQTDYMEDGEEIKTRPNRVFCVFVNDKYVAYNWRWEKCDPRNPQWPENYDTRFRRQLI